MLADERKTIGKSQYLTSPRSNLRKARFADSDQYIDQQIFDCRQTDLPIRWRLSEKFVGERDEIRWCILQLHRPRTDLQIFCKVTSAVFLMVISQ